LGGAARLPFVVQEAGSEAGNWHGGEGEGDAMRLEAKVAIITGGANGIGRATALLFAREGAPVVIADRDEAAGAETATAIRTAGGAAHFVRADVASDADAAVVVAAAVRQYGGVDVLVNAAGIDIQGSVVDTEPERWARVLDVNLASVYRMCRQAIPEMLRRGGGAIVNIASLQAMFGWPHYAAYAASKAGIIGLTRQIAVEYVDQNIRSNSVSPGAIETRLGENSARLEPALARDPSGPQPTTSDPRSTPTQRSRLRAPGRPEDVAYACLFLACEESGHVSGHNLVVDGGDSTRVEV
jgi:NAD(P)-dependent dehydrogenase (short-subunit alcohol dehydrogenase family)